MRGFNQALKRFEEAVRDHAFIGAQYPADHAAIEREYKEAKQALITLVTKEKAHASA